MSVLRLVSLLVLLLILYPSLSAFFVDSSSYSEGLRTTYLLFKQPLLAVLAIVLFFLLARSHSSPAKVPLSRWKEWGIFSFLGVVCLILATATQTNLNKILNEGISLAGKKVHWDSQRWGVLPFLSESDPVGEQYLWVRTPDQRLMKAVKGSIPAWGLSSHRATSEKVPGSFLSLLDSSKKVPGTFSQTTLKWYGIWQDGNGNGVLDDPVWLSANGERYDVTERYRAIVPGTPAILELHISSSVILSEATEGGRVEGSKNEILRLRPSFDRLRTGLAQNDSISTDIILHKEGTTDSVGWVAQATYLEGNTGTWNVNRGSWERSQFQEAMVWVAQPNHWWYSLLFKLGYCLRWLGMGLLFIAFFGRGWVMSTIRQSPAMAILSIGYAPLILLLGLGIRQSWPWLAQGVGWSLYGLLKLIPVGGKPFIRIPDGIHVDVGIERFWVNIADTCSGMESIGLFAGMYLGLILFNYRRLHLGRALALIIPGLVGTYMVNLVRIYLLFCNSLALRSS